MPDITLGSMATDFDGDAEEEMALRRQNGGGGRREGKDESSLATPSFSHNAPSAMGRPAQQRPTYDSQRRVGSSSSSRTLSPTSRRRLERRRQIAGTELDDASFSEASVAAMDVNPTYHTLAKSSAPTTGGGGKYLAIGDASASIQAGGSSGLDTRDPLEDDDLMSESHASLAESPSWEDPEEQAAAAAVAAGKENRDLRKSGTRRALAERSEPQKGRADDLRPQTAREQQEVRTLAGFQCRIATDTLEIDFFEQQFDRLQAENIDLKFKMEALQRAMSRFRDASMSDIINENAKLGAMLRKARDELSKNKKLVSALRKQLDAVMAEREALENERQRHQAELNNRADASADQSYLHELEEDLRRVEDEREDLKRQLEEAQETESVSATFHSCTCPGG